jgi:opacity protein-like surface antigen
LVLPPQGPIPEGTYTGIALAIFMTKPTGYQKIEEAALSFLLTNRFYDSADPLGGGVRAGYSFAPWSNNVVLGAFASMEWVNLTINHTFPAGTFLGTTTHWTVTAGAKAGFVTPPGALIYGLAGAAWLNQNLNINFGGPVTSSNTTTPGFVVGLGAEYRPLRAPVAVFAEYQHIWWNTANLLNPAASPGFNYAFKTEHDTFKLGLNFYFDAPPAAPAPTYPVKAPRLK